MSKILHEYDLSGRHIYMDVKDILKIEFTESNGTLTKLKEFKFTEAQIIDKIVIVKLGEEYGFLNGIGVLIGKSK